MNGGKHPGVNRETLRCAQGDNVTLIRNVLYLAGSAIDPPATGIGGSVYITSLSYNKLAEFSPQENIP